MSYAVTIRRRAQKELEAIPSPSFQSIEEKLLSLGKDPRPAGCKKLKGAERAWRIRVGDYRVIYEIDDGASIVVIIKIGHRSDIYR
jgi:mRNA interferase RelE/StbE